MGVDDHVVGASFARNGRFGLARYASDNTPAIGLGQLDRRNTDAPCAAEHKDTVS